MFRKMILTGLLAAGTITGLALTPTTAEARTPWTNHSHRDRHNDFKVLYLHRGHWDTYKTYCERDDAERAARQLRHRGYLVKIEGC